MKHKGIELKEITALQIFDPPKEMLVWDNEDSEPLIREVCAIIKHKKLTLAITTDIVYFCHCAEIPEEPKPRRATNRELAKWLAMGNGEVKLTDDTISISWSYFEDCKFNDPIDEYKVRKWDDTDWHEPTVDYMEIEDNLAFDHNVTSECIEIPEQCRKMLYFTEPNYFKETEVKIGNQVWMNKNLNVGDGGVGIYFNKDNGEYYYTWEAAKRIADKIPGWHLPSREEWNELVEAAGNDAANLKVESWKGTNKYGFSAVPAGNWYDGFRHVGSLANFCTSDTYGDYAWNCYIDTDTSVYELNHKQGIGFSVRLVKDR